MLVPTTQPPTSGFPEVVIYLWPKKIWPRYCRSYSNFQKLMPVIVQAGGYPEGAFRKIPQRNSRKRAYKQWQIHPTLGIEWLDKFFDARNGRLQ